MIYHDISGRELGVGTLRRSGHMDYGGATHYLKIYNFDGSLVASDPNLQIIIRTTYKQYKEYFKIVNTWTQVNGHIQAYLRELNNLEVCEVIADQQGAV